MSRQQDDGHGGAPGPSWGGRVQQTLDRFMRSRLFVQVVVAAGLLGVAGMATLVPAGAGQPVRNAFAWVVQTDYDFGGRARAAQGWVATQGGWGPALSGLWQAGTAQAKRLPGLLSRSKADGQSGSAEVPALARPAMPVDGPVLAEYGWPAEGMAGKFHEGMDLAAAKGTPVVAAMDGKVLSVESDAAHGTAIRVDHGRVITVYAQVEGPAVRPGDAVRRGDRLAVVAAPTGAEQSLPPHLHFEVRAQRGQYPIDPAPFLGLGGSKL